MAGGKERDGGRAQGFASENRVLHPATVSVLLSDPKAFVAEMPTLTESEPTDHENDVDHATPAEFATDTRQRSLPRT